MKIWSIVLALVGSITLGCAATRETVVNAPPERAADVEAIKGTVSRFYDAQNAFDVDAFMVLLADDSKVDSISAGRKVSKKEYGPLMANRWSKSESRAFTTQYRVLSVSVPDEAHAVAMAEFIVVRAPGPAGGAWTSPPNEEEWKLEKREGKWLIVDNTVTRKRF